MCKGSNTTTQTTSANPVAAQAYTSLLSQVPGTYGTTYQPYTGETTAPINAQQQTGIGNINNSATSWLPQIQQASGIAATNAAPITQQQIDQYENPFTQQVVGATQAQFNNQNQQQQQQLTGNAISSGAFGGNRTGIAAANLANQQQLAQAPVIAGLQSQGYTQGVNTALSEQQAGESGASNMAGIANTGENAGIAGGTAQLGAGTTEQQTQQLADTNALQQYLFNYFEPMQQLSSEAGVTTGLGSGLGGTSQTTAPAPSLISQLSGLGSLGLGAFGSTGAVPYLASLARGGAVQNGIANRAPTVPESPRTLMLQQHQLVQGHRRAVLFPHGTRELPVPPGMKRVEVHGEALHYNPDLISGTEVRRMVEDGHEHHLLDLGPYSKADIIHRVHGGEIPLAVVERHPDGTEARAALGTHATARHQMAMMHRTKSPGHTLHIEHPLHTLAARAHHHERARGGVASAFFGGGGVLTRDQGGPAGGMGGIAPVGPYASAYTSPFAGEASSYLPNGSGITRGKGPPAPPQPGGGMSPTVQNQASQIGQLAKLIGGDKTAQAKADAQDDANDLNGTNDADFTQGDWTGGAVRARDGIVPHYDDGGDVAWDPGSGIPVMAEHDPVDNPPDGAFGGPPPVDMRPRNPFTPPDAYVPPERNPFSGDTAPADSDIAVADKAPTTPRPADKAVPVTASPPIAPTSPDGAFGGPPPAANGIAGDVPLPRPRPDQPVMSPKAQYFGELEDKYGLPNGYLAPVSKIESGGNPRSYNELSGAKGEFQFIPSTARQYGLTNPWDPKASADAAARFAADNAKYLRAHGIEPTAGNLYLAHQQGPAGAVALLKNPDGRAVDVLAKAGFNPRNITANGGTGHMTAGQFASMWDRKIGSGGGEPDTKNLYAKADGKAPSGGISADATMETDAAPRRSFASNTAVARTDLAHGPHLGAVDLGSESKLWPALMTAGLGMMASKSPFPGVGIGEGGLAGMQEYNQAKREETAGKLSQSKLDMEAKRLDAELKRHSDDLSVRTKEAETHRLSEESQAKQRARMNVVETNSLTPDGHMVVRDKYSGTMYDGQTMQPIDAGTKLTFKPAGSAGGVWAAKKEGWLHVHPGDEQGALEYAGGHKAMSEPEMRKAAIGMAQKDVAEGRADNVPETAAKYEQLLKQGFGGGATPATPAAPSSPAATPPAAAPQPGPAPAPSIPTSQNPAPGRTAAPAAPAPPAGVPPQARLLRSKSGKVIWQAPDGSLYGPEGQLLQGAPQAAHAS